ncbi:hypothetical protein CLOM_g18752 [Closterium sp. NIES-68]|nr:hypothetical protein CLOM_g18752 [Closterium sp. NIES-68]GJP74778.1 hypothetical protein CLOP_g5316 [Closterium sp. NIES-67]
MARPSLQRSLFLCIFAGFVGACKPILARLSGAWRSFPLLSPIALLDTYNAADAFVSIICYGGVITLTVGMWHVYIASMEGISSLGATMISSSCSILWSGALGLLLLGEELKPRWFLGALCICGGLCLVALANNETTEEEGGEKEKQDQ